MDNKKNFWFVRFSMFDIARWVLLPCIRGYRTILKKQVITWLTSYSKPYRVVKLEVQLFANTTWSHDKWITGVGGCGQLNLSPTLLKLVAIVLAKVEIKLFLYITWLHDQWVTWLGGWDTLTPNHKCYSKSSRTQ